MDTLSFIADIFPLQTGMVNLACIVYYFGFLATKLENVFLDVTGDLKMPPNRRLENVVFFP